MKVEFRESFLRDLKKIKDKKIRKEVKRIIDELESGFSQYNIKEIKKITGYKDLYRIKMGDYRIGIKKDKERLIFVRILHRKDIYRYFP